jgi:hypothetical protein
LRTISASSLRSPEEISKFLRREIEELLSSGEKVSEVTISVAASAGQPATVERVVTLRMDGDGAPVVTVEGLVKNVVRIPIKKSSVGPSQFLSDEIDGTFESVDL